MIFKFRPAALLLAAPLALSACKKDDDKPNGVVEGGKTVFVVCEGQFNHGDGAITRFNKETKTTDRDIYKTVNNGEALGDVVQSMTISGSKGYIVVNNSNKVTVVGLPSFTKQADVPGLVQPRFAAVYNTAAIVSEWRNDYTQPGRISFIDTRSNLLANVGVATGPGPEELLVENSTIYVANSYGNTVTLLNADDVTQPPAGIVVRGAPTQLRRGRQQRIWVLCAGTVYNHDFTVNTALSTAPALVSFSTADPGNLTRLDFPAGAYVHNLALSPDGSTVYYTQDGAVYKMDAAATALPATPLLRRDFYGFGVDPQDGTLYGADAGTFTTDGKVIRYQPSGAAIDSFSTAVGPARFAFY